MPQPLGSLFWCLISLIMKLIFLISNENVLIYIHHLWSCPLLEECSFIFSISPYQVIKEASSFRLNQANSLSLFSYLLPSINSRLFYLNLSDRSKQPLQFHFKIFFEGYCALTVQLFIFFSSYITTNIVFSCNIMKHAASLWEELLFLSEKIMCCTNVLLNFCFLIEFFPHTC